MKLVPALAVLAVLASATLPCLAAELQGEWLTDPDQALATAAKAKKPVLAVAMDHA